MTKVINGSLSACDGAASQVVIAANEHGYFDKIESPENMALRHQLTVLQRQARGRIRLTKLDPGGACNDSYYYLRSVAMSVGRCRQQF